MSKRATAQNPTMRVTRARTSETYASAVSKTAEAVAGERAAAAAAALEAANLAAATAALEAANVAAAAAALEAANAAVRS